MSEKSVQKQQQLLMRISLWAGIGMLFIKFGAYFLTGSAALISDASETIVHLFAVFFANFSLRYSMKPADSDHPYGYARISFFSAGFEGAMISLAGCFSIFISIWKWVQGVPLTALGDGIFLTVFSVLINLLLGRVLILKGRATSSIILEANGKHLLADCWTSIGVILALVLIALTKFTWWDPVCGILIGVNILVSGGLLIRTSVRALMDAADPSIKERIQKHLDAETVARNATYHALRFRDAGSAYWMEVHLQFDDEMPLIEAHRLATEIELALKSILDRPLQVTTHLEPKEAHDIIHRK